LYILFLMALESLFFYYINELSRLEFLFFIFIIDRSLKLYFVLLMKSHLESYPCPLIINSFWNLGFLLAITIILQIITGIFLGLHYTSDLNSAYSSLFFFIREIFYGWCLRYLHSSGASFVFLFQFLHLGRAVSYGSYFYNPNTWFSGIILFFFLMGTAFMGYVLPFGQMSFWGATVITNLLSPFPSLIEWLCGGHYVYNPTLKRFFVFHFLFPFLLCGFVILHIFNLHFLSSNNPLRNSTNNKIPFLPFIISKDFYGNILILYLYLLQTHFGFSSFSHPDNALEACGLLTPLHIVPEWYFLCQYAMLKAVPNKNAGFIILFTSIFTFFYFMRSVSMSYYFIVFTCSRFNGIYLSFWFLSLLSFVWIGGQFPQDNFLSYGRILTLHYYFLLICILFSTLVHP
jgi:quinol-cytochrome oxidoreductase complex cytochrome b subunit